MVTVSHKLCSKCKLDKPAQDFNKSKRASTGLQSWCKQCHKDSQATPERKVVAARYAKARWADPRGREKLQVLNRKWAVQRHGISVAEYNGLLDKQGGTCAVCGNPCPSGRNLAVDHDHSCCPGYHSCGKCVRGLLCCNCNRAIGLLKDDPKLALAVVDYLEGYFE